MPTVEFAEKKVINNYRNFPCVNSHRPILHDLLSVFEQKEPEAFNMPNNLLIGAIVTVISRIKGYHWEDSSLKRCLLVELGIKENYKFPIELNNLMKYEIAQLEELVSIIFQTKSLREAGYTNGSLTRKQNGVFHTPYSIANLIAKEAIDIAADKIFSDIKDCNDKKRQRFLYNKFLNLSVIDPACGTGIILSATIDYLASINYKLGIFLSKAPYFKRRSEFIKYVVSNRVFGVDIDSKASSIVRALFIVKYGIRDSNLTNNIKSGDSLATGDLFFGNEFSYKEKFPDVFLRGSGFDILVMNPPYERLKVDKTDFKHANDSHRLYENNKKYISDFVSIVKRSQQYPLSDEGVLDLYKLFIDRATQITHEKGVVACIVPLSLLGDKSCRKIRSYIFESADIGNIYCIPETARAFHDVSQAFCIMGFRKGKTKKSFSIYEDTLSVEPLIYSKKININTSDIASICPATHSVPICDEEGWKILKKMHKFPVLGKLPDILNLRGELDLTFGAKYISTNSEDESLIRGNMIDTYTLKTGKNHKSSHVMLDRMLSDGFSRMKFQYINSERLVGQQIANMEVKKRLKFALIHKGVVANSCNFITLRKKSDNNLLYLLGLLNSAVLNWRFKLTSTNNHVNNYELDELPIVSSGKNFKVLKNKIRNKVVLQCEAYSEQRQMELDALVSLIYGLSLRDTVYVAKMNYIEKDFQRILEKAYINEKNNT